MSLRVFLPVSSAFRRVPDSASRFHPAEPGLVPDFKAARSPAGLELAASSSAGGASSTAGGVEAAGTKEEEKEKEKEPRADPRSLRRLPRWLERLLLTLFRSGNRRRGERAVQAELSFASVRVARNDLATADVEVVLVKPSVRSAGLSPECRGRLLRLWWDEGSRRLRRWGHTLW